jgi:DNA mismatch endonuclease, patch repair protein
MQAVKGQNTLPELAVRRLLYAAGYRYRLHVRRLPGTPDIVFSSRHKVVFVHGCFWHGHGCQIGRLPKSRLDYWSNKIETNRGRDSRNRRKLRLQGWKSLVVWQCEIKDLAALSAKLTIFLGDPKIRPNAAQQIMYD